MPPAEIGLFQVTTSLTAKSFTPASSASSVSHSGSSAAGSSRTHPSPLSAKSASSGDGTDKTVLLQLLPSLLTVIPRSLSTKQGRACVLTNKECFELMEQKKLQERETKIKVRGEKKKQKQDMKRKADETARKAAEKVKMLKRPRKQKRGLLKKEGKQQKK